MIPIDSHTPIDRFITQYAENPTGQEQTKNNVKIVENIINRITLRRYYSTSEDREIKQVTFKALKSKSVPKKLSQEILECAINSLMQGEKLDNFQEIINNLLTNGAKITEKAKGLLSIYRTQKLSAAKYQSDAEGCIESADIVLPYLEPKGSDTIQQDLLMRQQKVINELNTKVANLQQENDTASHHINIFVILTLILALYILFKV